MTFAAAEKAGASEVARHVARTAARLFAEKGYDATSVRMIVEAAGVTKPTLYYHFGSKEGLAEALLNVPLTALTAALGEIAGSDGDPLERLCRLFEAQFAFCREEPDRARFYYAVAFGPHSGGLAERFLGFAAALKEPVRRVVGRLAEAGVIDPSRADDFLLACRAMLTVIVLEFLYKIPCGPSVGPGNDDDDLGPRLAERVVANLLKGYGAPGWSGRGDDR